MIDTGNTYKDRVSRLIGWGHWFLVANIVLAIAMSTRYIFAKNVDDTFISIVYLIFTLAGHFALLGIVSYIVILFPLTFLFPSSKAMRAIGAVVATGAIVALLIDGSVYQNYQIHLNLLVFDLDGFNLDSSIGWSSIALFLLALLTVELTLANLIWKRLAVIRQWNIGNKVASVFFVAFFISHLIHIWADATLYQPVLSYDRTFPLSHGSTARSLLNKYGFNVTLRQERELSNSPTTITYPLHPLQCRANAANNLLIINLATANQQLLTPQVMPYLTDFAAKSIVATQHISTSLNPRLAKFNLDTGLPAQYSHIFNANQMPRLLNQQARAYGFKREFISDTNTSINQAVAQHDQTVTTNLVNFLNDSSSDALSASFYANITLFSSQEFDSPAGFMPKVTLEQQSLSAPERILARQYLRSLSYIDQLVKSIVTQVDLTTTTVVITANRGMDLTSLYNSSNQYSKVNLHVPLIISLPNTASGTINKLTSHYDVLPTLLKHSFGCTNPASDYSVGNDLLSTQTNDLIYIGVPDDFAIYQSQKIAEISRHGDFKFYNESYQRLNGVYLPFQAFIDLMAKQQRFSR
ncbi:MAG: DUF3413 domain-containing protein [Gammaproteobacteria bacterium]|nr:DUF3413 domain-containing protein [Gammaproteobacteria bacterium]